VIKNLSEITKDSLILIEAVLFDFDGVFTDNYVYVSEEGIESIRSSRSDGLGISRLKEIGIKTKIISTETNNVVIQRAKKLNIDCAYGVNDKTAEIKQFCNVNNINVQNVMFVGNDINDIPALKLVGFPVHVSDSYPEILQHIKFKTFKPGGYGAVREICDLIFYAHLASK